MNLSRGVRSARDRAVSSHAFLRVTASIRPERTARHRAMQVALVTSSFASDLAGPDDGDLRLALADRVRAPLLDLPETEGLELRLPLDEAEPILQERRELVLRLHRRLDELPGGGPPRRSLLVQRRDQLPREAFSLDPRVGRPVHVDHAAGERFLGTPFREADLERHGFRVHGDLLPLDPDAVLTLVHAGLDLPRVLALEHELHPLGPGLVDAVHVLRMERKLDAHPPPQLPGPQDLEVPRQGVPREELLEGGDQVERLGIFGADRNLPERPPRMHAELLPRRGHRREHALHEVHDVPHLLLGHRARLPVAQDAIQLRAGLVLRDDRRLLRPRAGPHPARPISLPPRAPRGPFGGSLPRAPPPMRITADRMGLSSRGPRCASASADTQRSFASSSETEAFSSAMRRSASTMNSGRGAGSSPSHTTARTRSPARSRMRVAPSPGTRRNATASGPG